MESVSQWWRTHSKDVQGKNKLNHFAVYLKLTQHCKLTILQLNTHTQTPKNPPKLFSVINEGMDI